MITERLINEILRQATDSGKRPDKNTIYVTDLASPCTRRSWFARRYEPMTLENEAIKLFGVVVHQTIQEGLRRRGYEIEVGLGLHVDGAKLTGRADAVSYDENLVVEIKTVTTLPDRPRDEHVVQANIYASILGLDNYCIVYVTRTDGRTRVFCGKADRLGLDEIKEMVKVVHKAIQSKTPPEPVKGPWCNYCPFKWHCWSQR